VKIKPKPNRKSSIQVKAYLVIRDLKDPIEIHLDQAKQLINLSYIGKLADEQRALLMDLKRVPVMPRWALGEFAGEVYLEVVG
jgi:hypothetical protein